MRRAVHEGGFQARIERDDSKADEGEGPLTVSRRKPLPKLSIYVGESSTTSKVRAFG